MVTTSGTVSFPAASGTIRPLREGQGEGWAIGKEGNRSKGKEKREERKEQEEEKRGEEEERKGDVEEVDRR